MKANAIILTSGITGSSVLAGLLAKSGYWAGETTNKKDYNTYENQELINLNLQLFREAGYVRNYTTESSPEVFERVAALYGQIDETPYRQFILKCNERGPWVWKDPRLWLTFHFWRNLLDLKTCRFILLTRDLRQGWLSMILRRQIIGYGAFRKQEEHVKNSILYALKSCGQSHIHITYDDLIAHPDQTVRSLSSFLGAELRVDDLKRVYSKPLYRAPRASAANSAKAVLIYLKNRRERSERIEADF